MHAPWSPAKSATAVELDCWRCRQAEILSLSSVDFATADRRSKARAQRIDD